MNLGQSLAKGLLERITSENQDYGEDFFNLLDSLHHHDSLIDLYTIRKSIFFVYFHDITVQVRSIKNNWSSECSEELGEYINDQTYLKRFITTQKYGEKIVDQIPELRSTIDEMGSWSKYATYILVWSGQRCIPHMPQLCYFGSPDTLEVHIKSLIVSLRKYCSKEYESVTRPKSKRSCGGIHKKFDLHDRELFCDLLLECMVMIGKYLLWNLHKHYPDDDLVSKWYQKLKERENMLVRRYGIPIMGMSSQVTKCSRNTKKYYLLRHSLIKTYLKICAFVVCGGEGEG